MQNIDQNTITVTETDLKEYKKRILKYFIISNLFTMFATFGIIHTLNNVVIMSEMIKGKQDYLKSQATQQKEQ
jgi:uncharacterized membrane protein YqjE